MTYKQLQALAFVTKGTLVGDGLRLEARFGGVTCTFELKVDSGTVVGCSIRAAHPGTRAGAGVTLELREETQADLDDKASGQTVEVQTGDARFDTEVFVDCDGTEDAVRRWLASAEVRKAVRDVVAKKGTIRVEDNAVSVALLERTTSGLFELETLRTLGRATAEIARAGPVHGAAVPGHGVVLWRLLWPLLILGGVYFLFAMNAYSLSSGWLVFLWWLGSGWLSWLVTRQLIRNSTAGDSGSGTRSRQMQFVTFVGAGLLLSAALLELNARLDAAPLEQREGAVLSVASQSDDDGRWRTVIQWDDDHQSIHDLGYRSTPMSRVVESWHPGLLARWGRHLRVSSP